MSEHTHVFKIVIVGDAAVGKSTLIERYIDDMCKEDQVYASTLGVAFRIKNIKIETPIESIKKVTYTCKLHVWDTAGQERFRSITQSYYRSSDIFIVCFDVTAVIGQGSIHSVAKWLKDVEIYRDPKKTHNIYVLGTRMDMISETKLKHLVMSDEFIKDIGQLRLINGLIKTKFIGVCSAKKDQFIDESMFSDFNRGTDTSHVLIDDMFKNIILNHINDVQNDTQNQKMIDLESKNKINLDETKSPSCCVVL